MEGQGEANIMNIELYIAGQLCDLEKADLGIRLRRQLFNPKELSTKDSQKSYSITLPATPRNNEIFQHKNVEETVGKFTFYPDARLYVNGILIMEGKFRLSSISTDGYRGNLGVPAPLTAKDVFGERKMNDAGEWLLKDFKGEKSITEYNTTLKADGSLRECIFPLALYTPLPDSPGTIIENSTVFGLEDFPPSINCIQMIKRFFDSAKYTLTGTALEDERLKNLYVSYKNPEDYILPYEVKKVSLTGYWKNLDEGKARNDTDKMIEKKIAVNEYTYSLEGDNNEYPIDLVCCNLFDSDNLKIIAKTDDTHQLGTVGNKVTYLVRKDGLYKIDLTANLKLNDSRFYGEYDLDGYHINYAQRRQNGYDRSFYNINCELQLIRHKERIFDLSQAQVENTFYENNQPYKIGDPTVIFPKPGCVNFIDPAQNENFICGFSWGRITQHNSTVQHGVKHRIPAYINPLADEETGNWSHPMAIKHGASSFDNKNQPQSAVYSPGYRKANNTDAGKLRVDLRNAIAETYLSKEGTDEKYNEWGADGRIQQMVWLKAGEYISLIINQSRTKQSGGNDWINQTLNFTLSVEPFRTIICGSK